MEEVVSKVSMKDEDKSATEAQGSICQLEGTDCTKPWTQEDQVYEELNTDQCDWRGACGCGQGLDHTRPHGVQWEAMGRFSRE